eukprot:TRINITY_DN47446_c0_g1_i2.p1 TRINITY_DN47446_c0_g1~~TRINITY_DN47446_c0_g1_i2.p1  ORF type:complete len:439 (-),score=83.55 TRINITY_DN47446_c0_g1_i2:45-1361(-)
MGNAADVNRCSTLERAPAAESTAPVRKTRAARPAGNATSSAEGTAGVIPWYEKMCESSASQDLFHAAANGDSKAAMAALVQHASPNCCNAEGLTALTSAIAGGHIDVTRLLVTSGAKVNAAPNTYGITPLSLASAQGCVEIVQLLLSWKADPNASQVGGNMPLARAGEAGHCEVCQLLLEASAQLDARDEVGRTALMRAVEHERLETTQLLLRFGAPSGSVDRASRSALSLVVDLLLRLEPLGKQPLSGMMNPHSQEVYWSQMCNILVERRADVNLVGADGDTLLSRVTRRRRKDLALRLLDLKCDPNHPVPALEGGPALLQAAKSRDRDLCQALVMRAASVNMATQAGVTPLSLAMEAGDEDLSFYLLQSGARADVRDPRTGMSMLTTAAAHGFRRLYDHLRQHVELTAIADASTCAEEVEDDEGAEYEYLSNASED